MQKNLPVNRLSRWLAGLFLVLLTTVSAQAQLTGTKTIPGSYATLAAAIADLNTQGVGAGGVTFNLAAGYAETFASPTAGAITATGTSANPIVFQKAGTGANPLITAGVGTSTTLDAIISLAGSDYVTFTGIDVAENSANTTATTQAEFGYALFRASVTDGCQNVSISNATITLNKTNVATVGIWGANTTAASATAITATSAAGANSVIKLNGNTVTNSFIGIYVTGNTATVANSDTGNEIGTTAGNTLTNLGGANTAVYGIRADYQNGLKIENNTITIPVGNTSTTVRGIGTGAGSTTGMTGTVLINNNTVTVASATSSTVWGINQAGTSALTASNVTNNRVQNSVTTSTGSVYYIQDASTAAALTTTITGNQVIGNSATTTGTVAGIYRSGATGTAVISNNLIGTAASGNTVAAAGTTFYGIQATTGTITLSGNSIINNTITATGTGVVTAYGYYNFGSPTAETLTNNTITGLSIVGNSTATTHVLGGIYTNTTATAVKAINGNTIGNLTLGTTGGTAAGTLTGILQYLGTTVAINQNKVYDLTAYGAASTTTGLLLSSGTTVTAANNLVGNLGAPAATSLTAISGVQVAGGTTANLYFNTIYLNATGGATFGTSGVYLNSTSTTLDLRNNIVVNTSTAVGTGGYTAALRRISGTAGTVPSNYTTTSNNNLFYAGTPSATNLLYVEGTTTATNALQTLAAYKAFMGNRDQQSVTENPPFASTTGAAANFLHIATGTATQVESGGAAISGITTDFDGDTRNATTPDIGADEGSFTPNDQSAPTITYTALGNTASTTSRTLAVTITDPSGIATGAGAPRIYYKLSTASTYFSAVATSVSGSTYTFTIDYANIGGTPAVGSTIQYYVAAQDASPNSNTGTSPVGGSGINPPGSTAPATPNSYQVLPTLVGTYYVTGTVGSSPTPAKEFATLTAAANAYNNSGLGGAVSFVLLDASYGANETFPIVLNGNLDASATNTLTIRPGTGVSPTITGSVATGAVLKLNGADYVTINGSNAGTTSQNLTITNTATTGTGNAVLWIAAASATDGATNNTVRNTIITGSSATGTPQFVVFLGGGGAGVASPTTSTPAPNSNNTLSNNLITRGFYGVFVFGVSATSLDQSNAITGNQIGQVAAGTGFGQEGVRVVYQQNLTLTGNDIQNINNGTTTANLYGIFLADSKNSVVSRNAVHGISYTGTSTTKVWAINTSITAFTTATNASANRFDNNLVYGLSSTATSSTWNTVGINLGGGYGDQIVYNTVYLSGQLSAASGTAGSAAFANGNPSVTSVATNIDVRNNIFSIIGGTGGNATTPLYANYTYGANYTGSTLNYNDLYVTAGATGLAVIGHLGTSTSPTGDYATLAAWQAATSQEANSVSVDPQFAQTAAVPYNLTPGNVALNNTGTPISGVTTDYTGATRGTTPDIGAIEFTPLSNDLAAAALVTPATTSACYGTAEPVSVSIRNAGTATLNFATTAATVTVVVTLPGGTTQTFTTTVNTGTLASNATQTVTLPGTLNMSTVGTYSFAVTATVAGDGNTSNDLLVPTPTRTVAAPVVGTLSPAASSICVSGTATLTLTGAANGSIQFQSSTDNVTFTDIANATSATYTTPVLTSTTYYRAQVRCNTGTATSNVSTITVNNPLVASTNTPVSICSGSTATLTATASAGSSVRFFSAATGGTALATAGSYTTPALTASTTYYVEAFSPSTSVAGLTDNSAANGTFSQSSATDYPLGFAVSQAGTLASVDVYPTAAGTLTIRLYSVSGTQPAGTSTAVAGSDVTITVTAAQVGTKVTIPLNYALTPGDYKLSNFAGGLGRYGTYTGTYPLTSADGVLTVKGSYTFYSSTSYSNTTYNSFFNLTFTGECVGATRTAIQVNVTQPATVAFPAATASTCGTTPYQLAGTVSGSATTGTYTTSGTGTFSPNATTLNAIYTPSAADITAGSVTITLSATAAPCAAATATLALSIGRPAVATFSYPAGTYCASSTGTVTPTLATGATAGTFTSTSGLTINAATGVITLSSSTAGTYTVTNTVAASGACAAVTATATITITPGTSAAFSYAATSYCQSGTNPTPTVTGNTGGTFSSTTGLSINATTGLITLSSSTPGTYTVTYTVAGACGSSATATVTITTGQLATFSYPAAGNCAGSTGTVAPTLATGATAGTFTSTTGLTLNATTGVVNLATSTAGTYTVTNTVAASGGCAAATATATITIGATPVANAGSAAAICSGSTAQLGAAATTGLTYSWSPATGLSSATIANPTVTLTNTTAAPTTTTYTLTVTNATGCSATSTVVVTVNPVPARPTLSAGYNGTVTTLTSSSTTGNQFYFNGSPITGATGQTYVINGSVTTYGSYTVVVTNSFGCVSQPSVAQVVTATRGNIAGASVQLYPNPTPNGHVTLELSGFRSATQLTVIDALGRVVSAETLPATTGVVTRALDLSRMASGVYILRLTNADGVETRRLTRE